MIYLFLAVALLQLIFWSFFFQYAYIPSPAGHLKPDPAARVSVIVCFRNEEARLKDCIERILAQHFPGKFELILVDDNSTDRSASIALPFTSRYDNVRLLKPGKTRPGKKDALAYGIEHAHYEHLLLTDADCVPASDNWLWHMTEPLRKGRELVLGVSPLLPGQPGGFLANWQWIESVYVSLKYLGFAYRRRPYMGVGRNLAYTKAFYLRAGGFADHTDIAGGDDDLLVSANADPQRTARVVNPAAWTYSSGKTTWREYFRQRGRHQSTGIRYPRSIGLWLGAVALSHGLFYLLGFYLLFTCYWWLALAAYCLRWLYLVLAYSRPLLKFDAGADAGCGPGHLRGAKKGLGSWAWLALMVVWGDALVGPMYLYLAVGSLWPNRDW